MEHQQNAHDQAEQLRKQVKDWKQQAGEQDVLSLPPRSEVHKQKQTKKRTKWKIKYPVIRLLALFFILLPISILSIYYLNEKKSIHVVTLKPSDSYEPIDIANQEEEEKTPPPVKQVETPGKQVETDKKSNRADTVSAQQRSAQELNKQNKQTYITHTVKENETLFSIAMQYYKSDEGMELIKKWNHLKSSQLHKGQVLQIPVIDLSK